MAKESGRAKSPNQLRADIERSRQRLERDLRELRSELDFPGKIRRSFQRRTGLWIAAIAVVGVLIAVRPARRKKVVVDAKPGAKPATKLVEAGLALGALRIAMMFLKPMIANLVIQKVRDYAESASTKQRR
jgi:hypothetical protein